MTNLYYKTLDKNPQNVNIATLPTALQQRLNKKKNPQKRNTSIQGYQLLAYALEDSFGHTIQQIDYSRAGKPFIPNSNISFSISHSKDIVGVVVTNKLTIGLDIEYKRPLKITDSSFAFFSEVEKEAILAAQKPSHRLINYWSKKEAFIKAVGGRMFDLANYTDVRKNIFEWKKEDFFFKQINLNKMYFTWLSYKGLGEEINIKKVQEV